MESLFDYFKDRKFSNRMYIVTDYVLVLPLETRPSALENTREVELRVCLERMHETDNKAWNNENLTAKQTRVLKPAC